MRYLGGKHLIGKELSEYIINNCDISTKNGYLEPFCGSLGVFKYMTDKGFKKCIASDIMPDLIQMWKELQNGTLKVPDKMTENEYNKLKELKDSSPNSQRAIAGFFLSFGGKYFGGYAQKWEKNDKNYLQTFKNGIEKIRPLISKPNVFFENKSYLEWNPVNMVIYCDPPYQKTERYSANEEQFNHEKFWDTMRKWSKNNVVFISEQTCPPDFKSIWSRLKKRTLTSKLKNRKVKREHLFVYNGNQQTRKNTKNTTKNKTQKR